MSRAQNSSTSANCPPLLLVAIMLLAPGIASAAAIAETGLDFKDYQMNLTDSRCEPRENGIIEIQIQDADKCRAKHKLCYFSFGTVFNKPADDDTILQALQPFAGKGACRQKDQFDDTHIDFADLIAHGRLPKYLDVIREIVIPRAVRAGCTAMKFDRVDGYDDRPGCGSATATAQAAIAVCDLFHATKSAAAPKGIACVQNGAYGLAPALSPVFDGFQSESCIQRGSVMDPYCNEAARAYETKGKPSILIQYVRATEEPRKAMSHQDLLRACKDGHRGSFTEIVLQSDQDISFNQGETCTSVEASPR